MLQCPAKVLQGICNALQFGPADSDPVASVTADLLRTCGICGGRSSTGTALTPEHSELPSQ